MKKILVLGAGFVAGPLVDYLLGFSDYGLTVVSRTKSAREALVKYHDRGTALDLNVSDEAKLEEAISTHDLTISLLPYTHHVKVADLCIKYQKPMITTSYISEEMRKRDQAARQAGILILNELGLDPGIDHLTVIRIVHQIQKQGGRVASLKSYCGGIPAPVADTNPFGYKFSWSPRGVLLAGRNSAKFLQAKKVVDISGEDLFDNFWPVDVPGVGVFEGYPNRDSLGYLYTYGLKDIDTMLRGTLRLPGWCLTMKAIADLNMLELESPAGFTGITWAEWTAHLSGLAAAEEVRDGVAAQLNLPADSEVLDRLEWLGLFSDQSLPLADAGPLDQLCELMQEKLDYEDGEPDRVVMFHELIAEFSDRRERTTSVLVLDGEPGGDTAMARTVGLPAAIGARMILEGKMNIVGVHNPVHREIYEPVLEELEQLGITFEEKTEVI